MRLVPGVGFAAGLLLARSLLFHSVNQGDQNYYRHNSSNYSHQSYAIHFAYPPVSRTLFRFSNLLFFVLYRSHLQSARCLRFSMMVMNAGTRMTIPILGKIKNTSGGISLMVVLAASSSAFCRR